MPPPTTDLSAEDTTALVERLQSLLELDELSFASISHAITHLSARDTHAQVAKTRVGLVETQLKAHLATMRDEEVLIDRWINELESSLSNTKQPDSNSESEVVPPPTHESESKREVLLRKAKEDRATLDGMKARGCGIAAPEITFSQLNRLQESNANKKDEIKEKQARLRAFQGLPANLDLARDKLRTAREAQMELVRTREKLLGQMAAGVA
ncbi:hypothetical protein HMN09_00370100 [Mycena chlorophos]|uniref:Uncharacterized protein n=1 Tax=Mycena chlorophos TaxID=658473 RepID=A0A8H6WNA5_MYCCL|nr:hypothetical protein HMN09_00370100 [Mycena chlorophos]